MGFEFWKFLMRPGFFQYFLTVQEIALPVKKLAGCTVTKITAHLQCPLASTVWAGQDPWPIQSASKQQKSDFYVKIWK